MEGQGGSCDGPDQVNEGIFLQYNVGAGWQDLPANQPPFSSNPMPYTNERTLFPWEWKSIVSSIQYMGTIFYPYSCGPWSKHSI